MKHQLDLPFAHITILRPNIAELVISDGIEITAEMVDEYQKLLLDTLSRPFGVLINKQNSYTYSFDAQMTLGMMQELKATAILVFRESSMMIMKNIKTLPDHTQWNSEIFFERDKAIAWLEQELWID